MTRQIIISSLPETDHQVANFYDATSLQFSQILFGKTGQISAFTTIAKAEHKDVVFCHRPEIICTEQSRNYFQNSGAPIHIHDWDDVDHLRFDSPKNVRLLKGVNNLVVTSYAETREILPLSPAAQVMNFYPAGTRGLLTYPNTDVSAYALPDGKPLTTDILTEDYVTADLRERFASPDSDDVRLPDLLRTGAIQAFSFAELIDPQSPWARAGYLFHEHCDFESAFARTTMRGRVDQSAAQPGTFILIPLNLDDDGRSLENLVLTIFSSMPTRHDDIPVCVAPFNVNLLNYARLKQLVQRCANVAGSQNLLRRFFLFFVRDNLAAPLLNRLFRTTIIDGSDPDSVWNLKRLNYVGIPSIVLTNTFNAQIWDHKRIALRTFKASRQSADELEDWYGKRVIVSDALSLEETADLMSLIEAQPQRSHEPHGPSPTVIRNDALEDALS